MGCYCMDEGEGEGDVEIPSHICEGLLLHTGRFDTADVQDVV